MTYQNPGELNVPQVFIKIINSTVAELRFNNSIPNQLLPLDLYRDTVLQVAITKYSVEEPDNLYYWGKTDWNLPHNKGKGTRSAKNLEKTRILYPEIYEIIKNKNISIRYTSIKNDKIFM